MQDDKQQTNKMAASGGLVADTTKEIPVVTQANQLQGVGEDDELDKLMRDVGKDLKQVGQKKPKRHWFSKQKKDKTEPKFMARPVDQAKPPAAALAPKPLATPEPPKPAQSSVPAAKTANKDKPQSDSRRPVGAVLLALIVTSCLIAVAYYAYK